MYLCMLVYVYPGMCNLCIYKHVRMHDLLYTSRSMLLFRSCVTVIWMWGIHVFLLSLMFKCLCFFVIALCCLMINKLIYSVEADEIPMELEHDDPEPEPW